MRAPEHVLAKHVTQVQCSIFINTYFSLTNSFFLALLYITFYLY